MASAARSKAAASKAVSAATEETSASMEELDANATETAHMADVLFQVASRFQLDVAPAAHGDVAAAAVVELRSPSAGDSVSWAA